MNKRNTITNECKKYNIKRQTYYYRRKVGLSHEEALNKPVTTGNKFHMVAGWAAFNLLYAHRKRRAAERNLPFTLTKAQMKQITKQPCFYCGKEPSHVVSHSTCYGDYVYQGFDQLYQGRGYDYANIVPCCLSCNTSKGSKDWDEYLSWLKHRKKAA